MSVDAIIALFVFVVVYYLIISEKIHRSIAVVLGAFTLTFFGVFEDPEYLFKNYVDFDTIFLLIGMMLLVSTIKSVGFFEYIAAKVIKLSRGSLISTYMLLIISVAVFSAFVDNVTTIMIFIPITLAITDIAGTNPVPFIIAEVLSSNIGGTATLIGDPPNILIGNAARFSFNDFLVNTGPAALVTLFVVLIFLLLIQFSKLKKHVKFEINFVNISRSNLLKSYAILLITLLLFVFQEFLGIHSSVIAFGMGFISVLILDPKNLEKHFMEIEWGTIFFFIGLFIITGALEDTGILSTVANILSNNLGDSPRMFGIVLMIASFFISGFFDNIPFTATMLPVIKMLPEINVNLTNLTPFWWGLSLGVCFGGNLTPIGASANIVAITMVSKYSNSKITFKDYMKLAIIPSLISLVISIVYVELRYF
ncbi:anion permease [Thermosipho ferrireducens]|uniref:Anion permease n=1 Tax=Thermosipho ferrireducens TaxID=2571116 RepID=A0ABX7S4U4_9BACT|nr:SLC13 family permease [Thermosipho ferrireducens]QTA37504.1 anion permease [Thermosipho ferrireducens]